MNHVILSEAKRNEESLHSLSSLIESVRRDPSAGLGVTFKLEQRDFAQRLFYQKDC